MDSQEFRQQLRTLNSCESSYEMRRRHAAAKLPPSLRCEMRINRF